eukprot:6193696-Pleurochrysis_carterae.AAC.1
MPPRSDLPPSSLASSSVALRSACHHRPRPRRRCVCRWQEALELMNRMRIRRIERDTLTCVPPRSLPQGCALLTQLLHTHPSLKP